MLRRLRGGNEEWGTHARQPQPFPGIKRNYLSKEWWGEAVGQPRIPKRAHTSEEGHPGLILTGTLNMEPCSVSKEACGVHVGTGFKVKW